MKQRVDGYAKNGNNKRDRNDKRKRDGSDKDSQERKKQQTKCQHCGKLAFHKAEDCHENLKNKNIHSKSKDYEKDSNRGKKPKTFKKEFVNVMKAYTKLKEQVKSNKSKRKRVIEDSSEEEDADAYLANMQDTLDEIKKDNVQEESSSESSDNEYIYLHDSHAMTICTFQMPVIGWPWHMPSYKRNSMLLRHSL